MVSYSDIVQAQGRIHSKINLTPVLTSRTLNEKVNSTCFIKCENFQKAGAFKFRGVCNKLFQLSKEEKDRGVITHSSGNHAQAVALASRVLKIKAVVVMPANAPQVKVNGVKGYGARVVRSENTMESREAVCNGLIKENGYTLLHGYDDDQIIAGAGTAALELLQKTEKLDYIFAPVGGGGLLSGTAVAAKGFDKKCKVIGVEPDRADDAFRSVRDNHLYPSEYPDTIADGLRTSMSEKTFQIIKNKVDEIVTVSEQEIISAMRFLWERMKIVVEPSGAVSVAGIFKFNDKLKGTRTGAIISGGNLDLEFLFNHFYTLIQGK